MPSPYNSAGHRDLREYIASADGWRWLALRDDTGSEVTRIDIRNDSRVTWSDAASNPLEAVMTLSGDDADIPTPTTFGGSALYDSETASDALHEDTFDDDPVVIDAGQTITVTHTIEQPDI